MAPPDPEDLEEAADGFRSAVTNQDGSDDAAQHLKLAHTYLEMGMSEEAIGSLVTASRSPRQRFEAALDARPALSQSAGSGRTRSSGSSAPPRRQRPTADAGRELLYDLGSTLEQTGRRRERWPCSWSCRPMPATTATSLPASPALAGPGGRLIIRTVSRLLFAAYFLEAGFILVVAPWSAFWEHNRFAASHADGRGAYQQPLRSWRRQRHRRHHRHRRACRSSSRRSSPVDGSPSVRRRPNNDAVAGPATRFIYCVTDRRRPADPSLPGLLGTSAQYCGQASVAIQIRETDLTDRELTDLVRSAVQAAAGRGVPVLVNDRLDVALAAGAAGVHLKERSIRPDRARAIAPADFAIGCSVHSAGDAEAVAATGACDYLFFGTVYPSASKPTQRAGRRRGARRRLPTRGAARPRHRRCRRIAYRPRSRPPARRAWRRSARSWLPIRLVSTNACARDDSRFPRWIPVSDLRSSISSVAVKWRATSSSSPRRERSRRGRTNSSRCSSCSPTMPIRRLRRRPKQRSPRCRQGR